MRMTCSIADGPTSLPELGVPKVVPLMMIIIGVASLSSNTSCANDRSAAFSEAVKTAFRSMIS